MTTADPLGGPVSAALAEALRCEVSRHGLVLWLDLTGEYDGFVARLQSAGAPPEHDYALHQFQGSHLELMFELEAAGGGLDASQTVIHLPGFNEARVHESPLLELYAAGVRFRKKLDTLVTEAASGRVRPEQIEAFKSQPNQTLERADRWLAELLDDRAGGLATQLRAMALPAVLDDLLSGGFIAGHVGTGDDGPVWAYLGAATGLPDTWRDAALPGATRRARDAAFAAASWALCVEYVDDLRRPPISPLIKAAAGLPKAVKVACRELAEHLRARHADFYARVADETETLLVDEVEGARAEDLGDIDTFRFEEGKVLEAALVALGEGAWDAAAEWATQRADGGSFWLTEDPARESAWRLVAASAALGQAIEAAGPHLKATAGLTDAVAHYEAQGAAVDRAHRHLEQRRISLLYSSLPRFEQIRQRLDDMRRRWRAWADAWATDFSAACARHGFLPDADLQQRTLFEQVVRPMTTEGNGATAYFMVDALRYEMAQELRDALAGTPATTLHLKPRLAELPTITAVGMNVLAPVAHNGKLQPAITGARITGFGTGDFRVGNPETRKRAMHERVGGSTCPWLSLEEVVSRDAASLKRSVSKAKLLVVHSQEIDNAGEKGAGPAFFDHVMQKLRTAWRLLRDAGVRRFVITSDHGFLMLDESSGTRQRHGRKIDPRRRHVISEVAADHSGEVRVPLADLGYQGVSGHLMFPETTAVFDTGKRSMTFVHGGNSLQERVIPVLTLVHRSAAGGNAATYAVQAKAEEAVFGMHALTGRVFMDAQGALNFGGPREVELSLTALDAPGVQVELCQTRKGAELRGGSILAKVDAEFEVFFRLIGPTDARVRVELSHPSAVARVTPCVVETRFAVTAAGDTGKRAEATHPPKPEGADWLGELPDGGVRDLFRHLAERGAVTEAEAQRMLGGPRQLRRFSRAFEAHAAKAPFDVRIDVVSGAKRYVRVGGS